MNIDIERNGGWTVLRLEGALNAGSASRAQAELLKTLDWGGRSFLLDFGKVTLLDSSGLATLVRFYKELRARGGTLALCAVRPDAMRVFQLTKLDKIFTIFPDDPEFARAA